MYIGKSNLSLQKEHVKQRQPNLYEWYCELEKILSNLGLESGVAIFDWELLGQGLLVEGNDKEAYLHFLHWVSFNLNIDFIQIEESALSDLSSILQNQKNPLILFIEPGCWPDLYVFDFIDMLGEQYLNKDIFHVQRKLGSLLCVDFPNFRRLGMLSIALQRRSNAQYGAVRWKDILEIAIHGTGEGEFNRPHTNLSQIAVHEAGHAVVSIIESSGKFFPDWVAILPGKSMDGIMVDDYVKSYYASGSMTFSEVRSSIRIALGGRVAEELILGEVGVGAYGANEDLRDATLKAMSLVAKSGFSANYGEDNYQGENLLVNSKEFGTSNLDYFQTQAREFIRLQYLATRNILEKNIEFLKDVQKKLMQDKLILQEDLIELCRGISWDKQLVAS